MLEAVVPLYMMFSVDITNVTRQSSRGLVKIGAQPLFLSIPVTPSYTVVFTDLSCLSNFVLTIRSRICVKKTSKRWSKDHDALNVHIPVVRIRRPVFSCPCHQLSSISTSCRHPHLTQMEIAQLSSSYLYECGSNFFLLFHRQSLPEFLLEKINQEDFTSNILRTYFHRLFCMAFFE